MENRGNWLVVGGLAVLIAGLVIAAVLLTRDGEEAADGTTTTSESATTTSSSTTTTESTTTTTVPLSPEDEIRRSAAALWELRDEVLQNPDPARIGEYAVEQSPLYPNDLDSINRLVAANARWASDPGQVLGVRLEANEGGSPRVSVVVESPEVDIVDASGAVLQHLPGDRRAYSMSLLGSPGRWRINDFFVGDQVLPSEIEDIIAQGVP